MVRFVTSKYMQISAYLIRYSLISIFKQWITENLQYIFFSPIYASNQLVKFYGDICKLKILSYSPPVSRLKSITWIFFFILFWQLICFQGINIILQGYEWMNQTLTDPIINT